MDESAATAAEKVQGLGEVLGCVLGLTVKALKHFTERKDQTNKGKNNGKQIGQWSSSNLNQGSWILDSSWSLKFVGLNLRLFCEMHHLRCHELNVTGGP